VSRWRPFGLLLAVWWAVTGTAAVAVEGGHPATVRAVQLSPDGALVERRVEVALEAGRQRLVVGDLPGGLDIGDLTFFLEPADAARVIARRLRVRHLAGPVSPRERELEERLAVLRDALRRQRNREKAAALQLQLLERIGAAGAGIASRGLVEGRIDPEAWRRAWQTVGVGVAEVLELQREAENEAKRLEKEIAALERELEAVGGGTAAGELVLDLEAARPGPCVLRIVHREGRAGFEPLVVAVLDADAGRLAIEQRALVHQRTGEDWEAIELTLAGIAAPGDVTPPEPEPWWVDLREPEPQPLPASPETRLLREIEPELDMMRAAPAPVVRPEHTAFHARWRIPVPVDVPADGSRMELVLDRTVLDARVALEAVPAVREAAFVVARTRWNGEVPLVAARTLLVRDGAPVGETEMGPALPGGELVLGFGVDPAVRVERTAVERLRGKGSWFTATRRLERTWVIRVENGHDRPVQLAVYERLPVPRDERLEVALAPDATPPDERDVDGRPGVLAWRLRLGPGERREIRFGFVLRWPEGLEPVGPDLWE